MKGNMSVRIDNSAQKRPLSSARIIKQRPQTSFTNTFNKKNSQTQRAQKEDKEKEDLDVLYLIMKTSPLKYDPQVVNEKSKKLNEYYAEKNRYASSTKTDELYYKYNLLYGTKSNDLIRSYSPKMRPQSASVSTFRKDTLLSEYDVTCFTKKEVDMIFNAKCSDLNIKSKENLEMKFREYCDSKCINRRADFTECNFKKNCAEILSHILRYNDRVGQLKLPKNCLSDEGVEILMQGIKNSLSIVHLDLSSNDITHKGGNIIFETLMDQHSIVSLSLSSLEGVNRNRITADGVKKLEKVLKVNEYLEFLHLAGNSLKNEGVKSILSGLNNNSTLHVLDLSNNEITSSGISYFSQILKSSKLFELDLSDNAFGNEGVDILGECINNPNLSSLKKLNISDCKVNFNGVFNLFYNLQNNKKLENLNLSKNNLSSEKFMQLRSFLNIVGLKELKLAKCKIGNEGAIAIAEGTCNNSAIKLLDISDNKIDDKGFAAFINVPIKNFSLEVLDISKNLISDDSCKEFARNLMNNHSFKNINFFDNLLRNETGTALIDVLRHNKNIIKMNMKFNRIQTRILEEINRLLKNNSDNYKQKYIPNLKREIRQNFITEEDFEQSDMKIKETGGNLKNLVEKLKEDTVKYSGMKSEEEIKLKESDDYSEMEILKLKDIEEKIRKMNNEQKMMTVSFNAQTENLNKDIAHYQEIIKILEISQKEKRIEFDNMKFQFDYDVTKLTSDLKYSEEKLTLSILSSESLKRDLENKRLLLQKLEQAESTPSSPSNKLKSQKTVIRGTIKEISQPSDKNALFKRDSVRSNSRSPVKRNSSVMPPKEFNLESKETKEFELDFKENLENLAKDTKKPEKKGGAKKKVNKRPKSVNPTSKPKAGSKPPVKKSEIKKPNI